MAIPNDVIVMSSNGEASTQSPKRKSTRKSSAAPARESPTAVKRPSTRSSGPIEILFTQEPDTTKDPIPPYIWIDFPKTNEALNVPLYVIRLGAGGADLVEISIDQSPWLPCRLTSGYWWYDWSGIARGKHTLVARMRLSDGRWFKTPPRPCEYQTE